MFIALLLLALPAAERLDQIEFAQIARAGNAELRQTALRLTSASRMQAGAGWLREKQQVAAGFTSAFEFRISGAGGQRGGADGLAFVLQNSGPEAVAGVGASGGFAVGHAENGDKRTLAIARSVAVFFDTHQNDGDPSNNYAAICTNGKVRKQMKWPPTRLGISRRLSVELKDGQVHQATVEFAPPLMKVTLDGEIILRAPVDLATILDRDGTAWVGFTASTGSGWANHDILTWSFTPGTEVASRLAFVNSDILFTTHGCLAGRNLCTPEKAAVESLAAGRYRITLPAHLEWGASVPYAGPVTVATPRGVVCWQAGQCTSGAAATEQQAGAGFLDPARPPGAMVARVRDGRTWFSVNGRVGAFQANEGYYEFEVRAGAP